jgi:putative tryptophan/tyrosine transport system substrate-binding protein
MRRRDFIILLLGAAVSPASALRAQQRVFRWIAYLGTPSPGPRAPYLVALRQGLSETGYVLGENVAIEYRWAEDRYDRLPALATQLVGGKVDVIVVGSSVALLAAKGATSTIPIVSFSGGDLVAAGLIDSLARPGGNLTGDSIMGPELEPKRLDLLSKLVPQARVIALLVNPNNKGAETAIRDAEEVARAKGLQLQILSAGTEADFETAFASLVRLHAGGLVVGSDPFFDSRSEVLVRLAAQHAVPTIYEWREFAQRGGLMSYGPSQIAIWRQVGAYVGRILAGASPADLPFEQPTKYELVVNLNTARELGLTTPPAILARADEVIE